MAVSIVHDKLILKYQNLVFPLKPFLKEIHGHVQQPLRKNPGMNSMEFL